MSEASAERAPSPKRVGNVSEALVFARLVELGYAVSIPFGDCQRYDFIVDDSRELRRVQVKTGRYRDGSVIFPTRSTNWHNRAQRGYEGDADDFLIYCPDLNEIYRVPVADCGASGSAGLRVDPPSRASGRPFLRWAQDHVFTERARPVNTEPLKACATVHPNTPSRIAEKTLPGGGVRRICKECNRVWNHQSVARRKQGA